MGASRLRNDWIELRQALRDFGVDPSLGQFQKHYRDEVANYLALRKEWDRGNTNVLPIPTSVYVPATAAEVCGAAHTLEFSLRRAADGVQASRPIAVDALVLIHRINSCLELIDSATTKSPGLLRKLCSVADGLSYSLFNLTRTVLGYLTGHFAPDLDQGRSAPDGWMDLEGTVSTRQQLLAIAVQAHRTQLRLRQFRGEALDGHYANMNAQRIVLHAQVASQDHSTGTLRERIGLLGWPQSDELKAIKSNLQVSQDADAEVRSQVLIAKACIAFVEGTQDELGPAVREAAEVEGMSGRNLISLLMTALQFTDDVDESIGVVLRVLDEVDEAPVNERHIILGSVLEGVLGALARIAVLEPDSVAAIARRVAGVPAEHVFASHQLWLIPGFPAIGLLEYSKSDTTAIELPGLSNLELLHDLIVNHAEEFEDTFPLNNLRKDLSEAITPLRKVVCDLTSPVTVHAFRHLKHLPIAGLTGRGSILAKQPICKILALGPARSSNGGEDTERLFIIDRELDQVAKLPGVTQHTSRSYDSSNVTNEIGVALEELHQTSAREVFFFGHGHVDQFHLGHSGLVFDQQENGGRFIPATTLCELDLARVELALVMACGSGQGNVFQEPTLSVGHAFRRAGAKHVIAPQWPIHAKAGLEFITRYIALLDAGVGYVEAWSTVLAQDPKTFISIALLGE